MTANGSEHGRSSMDPRLGIAIAKRFASCRLVLMSESSFCFVIIHYSHLSARFIVFCSAALLFLLFLILVAICWVHLVASVDIAVNYVIIIIMNMAVAPNEISIISRSVEKKCAVC